MHAKYSLVHLTNAACPPPDMIYAAAKAGFDCVSFRGIPTHLPGEASKSGGSVSEAVTGKMPFDFANNRQMLMETLCASKETGVVIHDTENARIYEGVDIRLYEPDIAAAAELGIRHILTNIWTNDKIFYTERFIELCELAGRYDITVNLEFVTWAGVKDLRESAGLLRASGQRNVGIVVDTLHYHRSRVTRAELAALPKEWFHYVHLCDCEKDIPTDIDKLIETGLKGRMFPGEGAVDIRGVVETLPHVVRGIEVPNPVRMSGIGFDAYIHQALETTKHYLEKP